MEHVDIEKLDNRMGPAAIKRAVSEGVSAMNVALNYYELAPGESFGFGYHRHPNQEELFYIEQGTVTFETEDGPVEVSDGECIRFAPGEWQRGTNESNDRVIALAIGAPTDMSDTEMLRECPNCSSRTENDIEMTDDRNALVTICTECGTETGRFD